jgi:cytochrome c553
MPASGNAARGRQLAEVGDETKLVQACSNCHGPQGSGSGAGYPYLAGQHAGYLAATLTAWRDGSRHNDPTGSMPVIAKSLDDADLQAAAAYYAGLPPPAQRMGAAPAPASSAASAIVSGPRQPASGSQAAQGTGTEQGAPVTGGAQGPGGGGANSGGGSTGSSTGQSTTGSAASGSAPQR